MRFRNGIIIAMIAFVAFIVTLAIVISSKDSELISEDYYIKEKSFNEDFDAQQRAADNKNPIQVVGRDELICFVNTSELDIQKLDLEFIRMNHGKADFTLKNQNLQTCLQSKKLEQGNYEIQMRYKVKNQDFLQVVTWYNK
ncbi:MAG: FixH [Bacteroidota bacterium]|jgi:hypothetical protein